MEIAKIEVFGIWARTVFNAGIPAGIVGASLSIEYKDPMWEDLNKTVVFRGCQTKDIVNAGDSVVIPAEVVEEQGIHIAVGVYGTDKYGEIVIPTIWASLGVTQSAADPSGDTSTDPQLPVWEQIRLMIGDTKDLSTQTKENIVAAINEIIRSGVAEDGFSPIAQVVQTANGAEISIIDKNGTTTATIANGKDGQDGYTPQKGIDYFDGQPGKDGKDGKDGSPGADGYTPVKGKDYYTEADKTEMVSAVIASLPVYQGEVVAV